MNRHTKYTLLIFSAVFIMISCSSKKVESLIDLSEDYRTAMMEADRNFSKLSAEKGMKYAMMEYIDSNGVLLRPNSMPIIGGQAINYISQGNDTSFVMTWEPNGGKVAASGDLGYTYGVYSFKPKNQDTVIYGTYVSIWRRQPDGKWKFTLETGNEGIE